MGRVSLVKLGSASIPRKSLSRIFGRVKFSSWIIRNFQQVLRSLCTVYRSSKIDVRIVDFDWNRFVVIDIEQVEDRV